MNIPALLLSATFLLLGAIHLYWLFGGEWALRETLPTDAEGNRLLNPGKFDIILVALGLLFFSWVYFQQTFIIYTLLPDRVLNVFLWIIPILFTLRAIGDFKYMGLFKQLKKTPFGKWDSLLFIPLCIVIALCGLCINLF